MENFDFDDYLRGALPPDQQAAFEQQLTDDADLRRRFKLWAALRGSDVADEKRSRLRQDFQQGLALYHAKQRKKRLWGAIMVILLLLLSGITWWYLSRKKSAGAAALYAAHFQPDIDFSMERSGTIPPAILQQLETAYTQKNYRLALMLLQQNKPATRASAYELHMAQLWLLEAQPDSAIAHLNLVERGATEEKHWYLALAYLQRDELNNAEKQLQIAQNGQGPFAEKAKKLLDQLLNAINTE